MKKKYVYLSLSLLCMLMIFLFSAQNGEDSSSTSNLVIFVLEKLFHLNISEQSPQFLETLSFLVRKCAHMSEYALLSILWGCYALETSIRKPYSFAFLISVFYAMSDEFHQSFVPGRSAQFSDVLVDASGALLGLLVLYLFIRIKKYYRERKKW